MNDHTLNNKKDSFMTSLAIRPAIAGLHDLSNESRIIATPWSRMVRGIGLGQYPIDYNPDDASQIRQAFGLLADKLPSTVGYTAFCHRLADLVLRLENPEQDIPPSRIREDLDLVLEAARGERNPYYRLMAGCILLDAVAKLNLDPALIANSEQDIPGEVLATLDDIEPDRIKDENSGRHGDYERLSGSTAVFLAFGQLGIQDRLVSTSRNYVAEALALLERIPSPFFRGRGGSMLLSAISILGYDSLIFDGPRNYMEEVLEYLDRADEIGNAPAFPSPMTEAFPKIYPLLAMLNSIAVTGRTEYLGYKHDRLAEVRALFDAIAPVERTHMGLYYLVALHNLGRLEDQIPDLDDFTQRLLGQFQSIDPGTDYFLCGISYPYLIQTAIFAGRPDLIPAEVPRRMVGAFLQLEKTEAGRANRPYPFSYVVNILAELGVSQILFQPNPDFDEMSPFEWVVKHVSEDGANEGTRLFMLDHALISWALRLRGAGKEESSVLAKIRFPIAVAN